jgi:hypothetical protein
MHISKRNFISPDNQVARDSYGNFYKVGELVGHSDPEEHRTAVILEFIPENSDEVSAITTLGLTHIDFLVKLPNIIKYNHHGSEVSVIEENQGKHRQNCLCFLGCRHFKPKERKNNCEIARKLFNLCVDYGLATPVWECAKFEQ